MKSVEISRNEYWPVYELEESKSNGSESIQIPESLWIKYQIMMANFNEVWEALHQIWENEVESR